MMAIFNLVDAFFHTYFSNWNLIVTDKNKKKKFNKLL